MAFAGIRKLLPARFETTLAKINRVREVLKSPIVQLDCYGDDYVLDTFKNFTQRHPRLPFIRKKTFGVCLQDLRRDDSDLFASPRFRSLRLKVRKTKKMGYTVREIDPMAHFDALMRVNTSQMTRQGRPIANSYTDPAIFKKSISEPGPWLAIFDASEAICGYCQAPIIGDVCTYSLILGHVDHLRNGVMYLLVYETACLMAEIYKTRGAPCWLMYDTFIGGSDGLREFKFLTGFDPYRVEWRWKNT